MNLSNFYDDYKKARDKAWEIIIKYNISSLPVDVFNLCNQMNVRTLSYTEGNPVIQAYNLTEHIKSNDVFTTLINGHYIIFYDDTIIPSNRIRFTISHELGHIVLGHLRLENIACRDHSTLWNRGEIKEPNPAETAANIFSSRLLSPACVLWALNIHTSDEISHLCGLSQTASKVRAERMEVLYARERIWLKMHNKSCFGMSPKERLVLSQFQDFINQSRRKE